MSGLSDPLLGRVLEGRYELRSQIARGGMATVYEALDLRLDRVVAIKVMRAGMGDDGAFARRFVREARAVARLSHPNVVAVFDQGEDDGTVYLAMELISGHTLRDTIAKESPMSAARAMMLIEPVLSALAAAHRTGVIHRDVKPENVLLDDDGRVKVADFGLAKAVTSDTAHSATTGALLGTISYVAPEILTEGRADARSDVYSAGVVLYELLTGRKPHQGENPMQVAYAHVNTDIPAVSESVADVPDYVDALVARSTSRDPAHRPADAAVLLHHAHRVSQALADGLTSDAELTADLAPAPSRTDTSDLTTEVAEAIAVTQPRTPEPPVRAAQPPPRPVPAPVAATPPARPKASRPPRRRRGMALFLVALLVALGGGGAAWWFGFARYVSTPGVLGMPRAEAEQRLSDRGLEVAFDDPSFSETVPENAVIASDPDAGSRVLREGTVTLTLSLGKERYDVPPMAGLNEDEAQDAIQGSRLSFAESVGRFSETVPEGDVIRSKPASGTRLRPGASVTLFLSKGRKPISVGDWVGKPIEDVRETYAKRGLEVEVTDEEFDDDIDKGSVISQDPSGGTLFKGDTVTFVVSRGPELVEVPSVRASGISAATDRLEDLGFEVEVEARVTNPLGFVFGSDPGAGSEVPKGSTITLFVV